MSILNESGRKKSHSEKSKIDIELKDYIVITQPEVDDWKVLNLGESTIFERIYSFRGYFYGLLKKDGRSKKGLNFNLHLVLILKLF